MTELLDPHDFDHTHADVSGGWLRAATFGAMDGLVTNTALIAGVGAAAGEHTVLLSGVAGLAAGAFSMALGEFTSVTTANEQIDAEVEVERRAIARNPEAEKAELVRMLMKKGLSEATARDAVEEIHADEEEAIAVHLSNEIGIQPGHRPSPYVAAGSSFLMFAIGAVIPLIPYLFGLGSLPIGLICGGVGLLIAGAFAAHFTKQSRWLGALRQLLFGAVAVGATYLIGDLIGAAIS